MNPIFTCGTAKCTGSSEADLALAVLTASNPPIGTEVGNYIYCGNYCCEITQKDGDRVNLVALGWKDLKECRLQP